MNVLVVPEDFRKDQFVLGPLVRRMMREIGKPNANVRICRDPLLGGINEALKWERIEQILDRYQGTMTIILLLVDRDGQEGRRQALDNLEKKAGRLLSSEQVFCAENAWQEIEVWALAGQDLPSEWNWQAIRRQPPQRPAAPDHRALKLGATLSRIAEISLARPGPRTRRYHHHH